MDLKSKYLVFAVIPCNLLLWGSESWDLCTSLLSKLEDFLQRSVRRILGITMTELKEERIRNAEVRERFFKTPTIQNQICKTTINLHWKGSAQLVTTVTYQTLDCMVQSQTKTRRSSPLEQEVHRAEHCTHPSLHW